MDTFQTLNDNDGDDNSDGDSQKNIIKETKFTVTSMSMGGVNGNGQPEVNEWGRKDGSHV